MNNTPTTRYSGFSLIGVLLTVFIFLKLTGNISWSWWWILAPLWGPYALIILIAALVAISVSIYKLFRK